MAVFGEQKIPRAVVIDDQVYALAAHGDKASDAENAFHGFQKKGDFTQRSLTDLGLKSEKASVEKTNAVLMQAYGSWNGKNIIGQLTEDGALKHSVVKVQIPPGVAPELVADAINIDQQNRLDGKDNAANSALQKIQDIKQDGEKQKFSGFDLAFAEKHGLMPVDSATETMMFAAQKLGDKFIVKQDGTKFDISDPAHLGGKSAIIDISPSRMVGRPVQINVEMPGADLPASIKLKEAVATLCQSVTGQKPILNATGKSSPLLPSPEILDEKAAALPHQRQQMHNITEMGNTIDDILNVSLGFGPPSVGGPSTPHYTRKNVPADIDTAHKKEALTAAGKKLSVDPDQLSAFADLAADDAKGKSAVPLAGLKTHAETLKVAKETGLGSSFSDLIANSPGQRYMDARGEAAHRINLKNISAATGVAVQDISAVVEKTAAITGSDIKLENVAAMSKIESGGQDDMARLLDRPAMQHKRNAFTLG